MRCRDTDLFGGYLALATTVKSIRKLSPLLETKSEIAKSEIRNKFPGRLVEEARNVPKQAQSLNNFYILSCAINFFGSCTLQFGLFFFLLFCGG